MVDEVNLRAPAVEMASVPGGSSDTVKPIETREELNEINPVIKQTRMAQEAFGLPSHVVPTSQQMDHVSGKFRQQRETAIAKESGQDLEQFEMQPQDVQVLDPSMVATGIDQPSSKKATPQGKQVSGGADLRELDKAFQMKKEGAAESLGQAATVDKMKEVNAIINEEAQAKIDENLLNDLDAAEAQRNRVANDVMAISRKFISSKIDPSRWYANRTTGQKIGISVAAFLSGFGGSDAVLKMVDSAIRNDIEAQKHDFTRSSGSIKNLIGMADKIYGQDVDKAKFVRAVMLENVANQLKVNSAKAQSPDAQSKLKTAISGIEIEKQKLFESMALDRAKIASDLRKEDKLTDTRARSLVTLGSARNAFNEAFRALQSGNWTKRPIGDNKFTAASREFVTKYLFFLSGANVPVSEKDEVKSWLAQMTDTRSIQKWKMERMRKILNQEMGILKSKTMEDAEKVIGSGSRNKFFKPRK